MSESVVYQCLRCGNSMSEADLDIRGGAAKCIHCGYRVIRKTRPPVVKRIESM